MGYFKKSIRKEKRLIKSLRSFGLVSGYLAFIYLSKL